MVRYLSIIVASSALLGAQQAGSDEIAMVHLVGLEYPPIAAQAQIQGRVVLKCTLRSNGRVDRVQIISGHPVLSKVASANASKWLFRVPSGPERNDLIFTIVYNFRLEGECLAPRCTSTFSFDSPNAVTLVTQARHWNP